MKSLRLKNKANRSKDPVDIANDASNSKSSRPCKPYYSNKHARGDSRIMLIETDKMLLKHKETVKKFNQYFGHITDSRSAKDLMILKT